MGTLSDLVTLLLWAGWTTTGNSATIQTFFLFERFGFYSMSHLRREGNHYLMKRKHFPWKGIISTRAHSSLFYMKLIYSYMELFLSPANSIRFVAPGHQREIRFPLINFQNQLQCPLWAVLY